MKAHVLLIVLIGKWYTITTEILQISFQTFIKNVNSIVIKRSNHIINKNNIFLLHFSVNFLFFFQSF